MSYRLGVDVGGTFTDLLLINEDTGDNPYGQSALDTRGFLHWCSQWYCAHL